MNQELNAILSFTQKYSVELVIGFWLLVKIINNAGKIVDGLAKFSPPLSKWLEARREDKRQERVEKEVITSAKLSAQIERDQVALHHELDSDAVNQAHTLRQDDRMLGIVEKTLDNFWQEQQRNSERWAVILQALADNKNAMMNFKSTLSLLSQAIAQQTDAYAALECVKAARRAVARRKTNGD